MTEGSDDPESRVAMTHSRDHNLELPLAAPTACIHWDCAGRRRELDRGWPAHDGNGTKRKGQIHCD